MGIPVIWLIFRPEPITVVHSETAFSGVGLQSVPLALAAVVGSAKNAANAAVARIVPVTIAFRSLFTYAPSAPRTHASPSGRPFLSRSCRRLPRNNARGVEPLATTLTGRFGVLLM